MIPNNGDLVKIPQKVVLWKDDYVHYRLTEEVELGLVADKLQDSQYRVLVGEEFWLVSQEDMCLIGANDAKIKRSI